MSPKILPGRAYPLGATPSADGTNFAVASAGDEVTLCLFDPDGVETRLLLPERDGDTRHGFVPGVTSGQAYGFRVSGPYDPARGLRGIVKLFENTCGSVDVSGLCGGT